MNIKAWLVSIAALTAAVAISGEPAAAQTAPAPASQTQSRPKAEPYVDDATGVEFPASLENLVKTQVVKSGNPYYGTVVRYASLDGSCADVYIYSLGQTPDSDALQTHFQGVMKVIGKLPGETGPVRGVSFKSEGDVKLGAKESIAAKRAVFSFESSGGDVFDSELLLFAFKDKVVKIRVSRLHDFACESPEPFVRDVAMLFEGAAAKAAR